MKICVFGTRGFPDIQGGVEKHGEHLYPRFPADCEFTVFRRRHQQMPDGSEEGADG